MPENAVIPVLLAGGSGTRLWPVSRKDRPKQFAAFRGDRTLFQETCLRVSAPGFAPPIVLANAAHRFQAAEQLREIAINGARIVLEPTGRDTAPAACVAALLGAQTDRDALVLLTPCDHVYGEDATFREAIAAGIPSAKSGAIVVFGARPTGPHTGYGYIEVADGTATPPLRVERFVEKPDRPTAEKFLASGRHFWNAGVFLFKASTMLDAFAKHEPGILAACRAALTERGNRSGFRAALHDALRRGQEDIARLRDHGKGFARSPAYRSRPSGATAARGRRLREIATLDAAGNASRGDVLFIDSTGSMGRSDDRLLVVYGLDRVVAVATPDAVLVTSLDRAEDLKRVVSALEAANRPETSAPEGLRQAGGKAT